MASFDEHINQAKRNCEFLALVNRDYPLYWDWQTTIAFYAGVHLINAHIARKANLHYRSHEHVENAISPYSLASPCKLPEQIYSAYTQLQWLSRRSRYLISDEASDQSTGVHFTKGKHLTRAIKRLNILLEYIAIQYGQNFNTYSIDCPKLESETLKYFSDRPATTGLTA